MSRVVEAVPDQTGWILTLQHIHWHDGRPVTAADVCFSVATALDPRAPAWWRGPVAERVSACTVLDARRARLSADGDPREALGIPLVPRHAYTQENPWFNPRLGSAPIGTGRYRATRTSAGWTLRARGSSGISAFHLTSAESDDAAVDRLLAGEGDGVLAVPPARVPGVVAADGLALRWANHQQITLIALDPGDGPTADPAVRRALDRLLDRPRLRERVVGIDPTDDRQPATLVSGPFYPRSPWSARSIPPTLHDSADAAEALSQSGFTWTGSHWVRDGAPLRIRVATGPPPLGSASLLYAACGQWLTAGIEVEAVVLSRSAYALALEGHPPAGLDALVMSWTPPWGESPRGLVASTGWSNPFRYADPAVDRELDRLSDPDPDVARRAGWELHGRLADRIPFLFLWTNDAWSAWSDSAVTFTPLTPGDLFGAVESWR